MTFPAVPAIITVLLAFGADLTADPATWTFTDVTPDWETAVPITTKDGRSEGATQAEAAEATFALRCPDARYMPDDPRSIHWPDVVDGTPAWVILDAGEGDYDIVQGFVASWVPEWPSRNRSYCIVKVTVRGILDRLGRGTAPLTPPLQRAIVADAPAVAWGLGDGPNATQAASMLPGGTPMTVAGAPVFGETPGPVGTAGTALRIVTTGDTPLGSASARVSVGSGGWTIEGWGSAVMSSGASLAYAPIFGWETSGGTWPLWQANIVYNGLGWFLSVDSMTADGTISGPAGPSSTATIMDGSWHHFRLSIIQNGGNIDGSFWVDGALAQTWSEAGTAGTITRITTGRTESYWIGTDEVAVSSIAAWPGSSTADHWDAGNGYPGELASDRIARVCAEAGVSVDISPGDSHAMGPQPAGGLLAVLRECEAVDQGRLGEAGWGLSWRPLQDLLNQAVALTLTGSAKEVADPFAPVADLQRRRNEWTISRTGGSSSTWRDEADQKRRGQLGDSAEINCATDEDTLYQAQWRVGAGITRGMRYPSLSTDLGRHPGLIAAWQAMRVGDRVQATQPVSQHPLDSIDQIVEGRQQTVTPTTWKATMVTSPARPFDAFTVADLTLGRLEGDAQLAADIGPNTSVMGVTTTAVRLVQFVDHPEVFPISADLGGEKVTITDIVGSSSPQTIGVIRSVNGITKEHPAGEPLRIWRGGQLAL